MYEERTSRVPGAVVWRRASDMAAIPGAAESAATSGTAGDARVLPDGCMDLIWVSGELLVAGPDTVAHLVPHQPDVRYVGLRFAPGTAPALLGVPAVELRDRRVPLDELWPSAEARRLRERAGEAADPAAALEDAVLPRLATGGRGSGVTGGPALVDAVMAGVRDGRSVRETAADAGLSERHLHRRCLDAFGYGPRTLGRILRLNRALDLARGGTPFADVAAVAGYADQAHLSREVRSLTGVPLSVLLAAS
ncbi:helix-turn-helix transcriptional regulator [Microbispora sp. ATCC PTA-5024]|uniref:helix-turn-helix transcriptional regulator n=1 Tax=Microbispora sp. ATCC PTA-5024 TaxID=316330 RepID=UPI0003DBA8EC|nr:helix-turn-helix transcriptional regulator [Microbispora sp. ATCC PTA-5024]ETK37844.1 AraC family transcriptional regulator [Microbispora sp. ATCC PTA-5024]